MIVESRLGTINHQNAELEKRKQRVKMLKRAIIFTLISVIVLPIIMCICLLVKVNSMQEQIDELYLMKAEKQLQEQLASEKELSEERKEEVEILASQLPETTETEEIVSSDEKKKVYLTFDDGPSSNTEAILKILKEYNVKATFFVVGKEDEESLELYQKIVEEGHAIGMHTYSHQYSTIYQSVDTFAKDVERLQILLEKTTGQKVKIFRFPGGSSNMVSNIGMEEFIKYLNQAGITYYDWNVSSGDATSKYLETEELVENVLQDVKIYNTSIVLMHDAANKPNTVEALGNMIEELQGMEVEILPITEDVKPIQHISAEQVE